MAADEADLRRQRWRLVLGDTGEEEEQKFSPQEQEVDALLEKIYPARREGGLPQDRRFSARWFRDITEFFEEPVVEIVQQDLVDRLGLKRLLKDPEVLDDLQPNIELATAILSLKDRLPPEAMTTARQLVQKLARSLEERLKFNLLNRISGARQQGYRILNPRLRDVDWHKTIKTNLRHYQAELRTIIPARLLGHPRARKAVKEIVIVVDQSASMLESFVHSAVIASILSSIPSLKTHLIVFDTDVVDLTGDIQDPVTVLFKGQLGGGTDIAKAIRYVRKLVRNHVNAHVVLISDLYEGGNIEVLVEEAKALREDLVQMAVVLALDDRGKPDYDRQVADRLAALDIASLACPPEKFPAFIASFLNDERWKTVSDLGTL